MKQHALFRRKFVLFVNSERSRMTVSNLIVLWSLAIVIAAIQEPAHAEEPLTAREIIDRAVARADAQYESQAETSFEWESKSIIQSLDDKHRVTKTERNRYRLYPVHGAIFDELIEKNGRPLSDKERRKEEQKKQEFIREVEKRKARGEHPQPEEEPDIHFGKDLVSRYQLEFAGIDTVQEYRCWVIAFKPKDGKLPVRRRIDRALNQTTGRFFISQDDYGLARLEFTLSKPFNYWGGFLAVIRKTDGQFDFKRVEENLWLPHHFNLNLDMRIMMIKDIRRHIEINWTGYKRINPSIKPAVTKDRDITASTLKIPR